MSGTQETIAYNSGYQIVPWNHTNGKMLNHFAALIEFKFLKLFFAFVYRTVSLGLLISQQNAIQLQ